MGSCSRPGSNRRLSGRDGRRPHGFGTDFRSTPSAHHRLRYLRGGPGPELVRGGLQLLGSVAALGRPAERRRRFGVRRCQCRPGWRRCRFGRRPRRRGQPALQGEPGPELHHLDGSHRSQLDDGWRYRRRRHVRVRFGAAPAPGRGRGRRGRCGRRRVRVVPGAAKAPITPAGPAAPACPETAVAVPRLRLPARPVGPGRLRAPVRHRLRAPSVWEDLRHREAVPEAVATSVEGAAGRTQAAAAAPASARRAASSASPTTRASGTAGVTLPLSTGRPRLRLRQAVLAVTAGSFPLRVPATGSLPPAAESSRTAAPASTALKVERRSTVPSSVWLPHRPEADTGSSPRMPVCSTTDREVLRIGRESPAQQADRGHGGHTRRQGVLARGE